MTEYKEYTCAICDSLASNKIPETNTPLCVPCSTAYEWGQNSIDDTAIATDRILEPLD